MSNEPVDDVDAQVFGVGDALRDKVSLLGEALNACGDGSELLQLLDDPGPICRRGLHPLDACRREVAVQAGL